MKNKNKEKIICLVGPTAVGKTEVALKLAKGINAEIISCDSMQIYKGIDIATSKPTKEQRKKVKHHLIDIVKPSQGYNAARFAGSSRKIIKRIIAQGKTPLIVCGTGLYLKALLDGLFKGPGQNSILRRKFYQQARRYGLCYLYSRLGNKDPQAASKVHPHDLRRIVRALEVYETSGKPISQLQKKTSGIRGKYDLRLFGLQRPRNELYSRIEKRVEWMFRRGLVAEIRRLTQGRISQTAKSLLGYKEICGSIKGEYSCDRAKELLKRNTRRYAKRQISWFKHQQQVKWIEIGPGDSPEIVAEKILILLPQN